MAFNKIFVIILICFIGQIPETDAQYKQNFGLSHPQDPKTLPKSDTKPVIPRLKEKVQPQTVLQPTGTNEWIISGGWELAEGKIVTAQKESPLSSSVNTSKWYNATVPGTVLTTLVEQGVYPDPYYGLNNLVIPDSLCRTDWWYRTSFKLPENSGKKIWLQFNGINYKALIWLNGSLIGTIKGAFRQGHFDVTDLVHKNEDNILAVHILPPPNPGIPHEESPSAGQGPNGGQLCMDGPTFISSEGWDWVPGIRDRNIGIWQDVRLKYTNEVTIKNTQVITDLPLPDTTRVDITIRADVSNFSDKEQTVKITGTIDKIAFEKNVVLLPHQKQNVEFSANEFPQLRLLNPLLWWPNGYGRPNLYTLVLKVSKENTEYHHPVWGKGTFV